MAKKKNEGSRKPGTRRDLVEVRVRWGPAEELKTLHVNQLHINHSGPEFYLTFGELVPPLFTNPGDIPDEVEIVPKVRLAISPKAMLEIARAISENVGKYTNEEGVGE